MSRSSSRQKQPSRYYEIVNNKSSLAAKPSHRNTHNDSHRDYHHRNRFSQERSKRPYNSRRTPDEGHSSSRQRLRHSSVKVSPGYTVKDNYQRALNDQRRPSYSRSPRNRSRQANKCPNKDKKHSQLSFSSDNLQSSTELNAPNRAITNADSPESFIHLFKSSPVSPNSSFGNSLFDCIPAQPKNPILVPPDEVYIPEALHFLSLPSSLPVLPSLMAVQKEVAEVDGIMPGTRVAKENAEEEEVVPMDLASCPSARSLEAGNGPTQRPSTPPPQEKPFVECKKENNSFTNDSSMTGPSAGIEVSKATKARNERLRSKLVPAKRITLPSLHLHLSEDGTSPLPPGWQRAPNPSPTQGVEDGGYPYYYFHTKTRLTRWDPPVYPWDADPEDNLVPDRLLDDPEAPYNWNCAHRYAVTHEEIEAMYAQYRSRMLERQCMELIHEMGARPDVPQGAQEQGFSIELFSLIHNELRKFRDARVDLGRITNDEDLHHLTNKLALEVIPKEIRNLHRAQQASASSLFAAVAAETTPAIRARVASYVRRYMESKGSCYRRFIPPHHHHRNHQHDHGGC